MPRSRRVWRPMDRFPCRFVSSRAVVALLRYMLTDPPAPAAFWVAPCPPPNAPMGPFTISTRSIRNGSMNSPAPRPIGSTPSNVGSVPPNPRMENVPGWRIRRDFPPVSMPGTYRKRSCRSVGLCSRMKSSVKVSTTTGNFSGGTSVNVPPFTVWGRYFESAAPSTMTVPRSATAFVWTASAKPAYAAKPAAQKHNCRFI